MNITIESKKINKYLVDLENKNVDNVISDKLCNISETIDSMFPQNLLYPTLLPRYKKKEEYSDKEMSKEKKKED